MTNQDFLQFPSAILPDKLVQREKKKKEAKIKLNRGSDLKYLMNDALWLSWDYRARSFSINFKTLHTKSRVVMTPSSLISED